MLHPVLVSKADVVDSYTVRSRGGDGVHHLLHLRICRVKIADVIPQNALRIALPDTYGSAQFWRDMPKDLVQEVAETYRGDEMTSNCAAANSTVPQCHRTGGI